MSHIRSILIASLLILAAATPAVSAPAFDEKPTPMTAPLPQYPDALRAERAEGTVIIRVSIDATGSVTEAEVVKSTDARFENAAVETVKKKWRFSPAKKDGSAVACRVNVPIRFSLSE